MATTKRHPGAKQRKNGSAGAVLPLRWSALEFAPKKRWWWFVGLAAVSLWLCGLALAFQIWSLLAVIVATTLVFFVVYLSTPRVWRYALTKRELRVESGDKTLAFRLELYRAFAIEEISRGRGSDPYELLVLLPRGRFQPARDVYLTEDVERNLMIVEGLRSVLAYDEARSYQQNEGFLNRLARFLRIG